MHDEIIPAKEEAAYWVEHILRHGGKHLQSRGKEMPFHQLYLIDIWLALIAIPVAILVVIIKLCKCKSRKVKTQ